MRGLWQWLRRVWQRGADRREEQAIEAVVVEHELAARRSANPNEPLPPVPGNGLGPF
jgi:hypothetical protein